MLNNKVFVRVIVYVVLLVMLAGIFCYQIFQNKDVLGIYKLLSVAKPIQVQIPKSEVIITTASELSLQIRTDVELQRNIILNALPKSASEYIAATLEHGLDYHRKRISSEYIPRDQVIFKDLQLFYETPHNITKQHLDPSSLNINILKRFTRKLVVHVRDPREVLLSWVYYLRELKEHDADLYYFEPEPPAEYYALTLHQQIDWNIENFLPHMVAWIDGWLAVKQREDQLTDGLKILLTTYDEFYANETKFFAKILDFYAIPESEFKGQILNKDEQEIHFRTGVLGEWRGVFTDAQKDKINRILSAQLLQRFNWQE